MTTIDDAQQSQDDDLDFEIEAGRAGPGTYLATLTTLEPLVITVTDDETGESEERDILEWDFTTEDGNTAKGVSSRKTGPETKAYRWFCALLGVDELPPRKRLSRRDLIGREAQIEVRQDKDPKFSKLHEVYPVE